MRTLKSHATVYTTFILSTALALGSCKKDKDDDIDPPVVEVVHAYSGSGSEGDLITFEVNQTNRTYTVDNETTGDSESGSYSILDNNSLDGVYQVQAGSDNFYAVELDEKIIAANFPTGNPLNNISFGVSSALDNTGNTGNIAGSYVYIIMDNNGVMNDPYTKEWGILNVKSDGTWIRKEYASNTGDGSMTELNPESYTGSLPIGSGDETGGWSVNGTHKERLDVTMNGTSGTLSGYVYATADEAAFLLDLGTGNGFLIGLKITNNASFSSMAGDYKFVNVWDNGYGAGNYNISGSGNVNWSHQGSDGTSDGSFQLTQCQNAFSNIFYCNSVDLGDNYYEKIYCIVIGDIILEFGFDNSNGNFAQYGVGAKL